MKFGQNIHKASKNKSMSGISFILNISLVMAVNETGSANYSILKVTYYSFKVINERFRIICEPASHASHFG